MYIYISIQIYTVNIHTYKLYIWHQALYGGHRGATHERGEPDHRVQVRHAKTGRPGRVSPGSPMQNGDVMGLSP
jgi:hypothetical protein